jgi:hypothetical protein
MGHSFEHMKLRYRTWGMKEKFLIWLAWHMPSELVKWCYIRVGAYATTGKHGDTIVPAISMMEALDRWDRKND